jgi:hypothetical protein
MLGDGRVLVIAAPTHVCGDPFSLVARFNQFEMI